MEFIRVSIKVPKTLHDKYIKMASETGVAKSGLMVLDMKKARDTEEIMESMKTAKKENA